jgi:hypothetical protein
MSQTSDAASSAETVPSEDRQRLLAQVAGSIAAGIVVVPSKSTTTAAAIAEVAVDIADAILKRVGL